MTCSPPETLYERLVGQFADELDCRDFYDLMQFYRHMPVTKQVETVEAYEQVKKWIAEHLATLAVEQARQVIDEATAQEGDWSPRRRVHFATVIAALGEVKR